MILAGGNPSPSRRREPHPIWRLLKLAASVGLGLPASAAARSDGAAQVHVRPAHPQGEWIEVTVENRSGIAIQEIKISPVAAQNWGRNQAPQGVAPGEMMRVTLPRSRGCLWDFRMEVVPREGRERRGVDICATPVLIFE